MAHDTMCQVWRGGDDSAAVVLHLQPLALLAVTLVLAVSVALLFFVFALSLSLYSSSPAVAVSVQRSLLHPQATPAVMVARRMLRYATASLLFVLLGCDRGE